jgi:hypothetical protein
MATRCGGENLPGVAGRNLNGRFPLGYRWEARTCQSGRQLQIRLRNRTVRFGMASARMTVAFGKIGHGNPSRPGRREGLFVTGNALPRDRQSEPTAQSDLTVHRPRGRQPKPRRPE